MHVRSRLLIAALTLGFGAAMLPAAEPSSADAHFERTIRPILATHCFGCHGPEKQKSSLRLDSLQAMQAGGSRGPAVVAGHTDSLLLEAIRQTGDLKMPPDGALSAPEIEAITAWIAAGANWPEYKPAPTGKGVMERRAAHWAYQPLAQTTEPDVAGTAWPQSDVDRYLLHAMETAGLSPSPEADRRTLIRRLSYDLTGLPPSPEDVDAFVADTRPEAYTALVEKLLASPQYGERWARHWLDVVRYTDSFDSRASAQTDPVEIWRYRDWVVNALNNDMPYDQFVQQQIAGDLLPGPDGGYNRDGQIATGVLAIGHWPQGDADKQKMVSDIVDDQVDLVSRTFLSVTMACARCHDHKFDPFTTAEYYGLAGIFFSSSILPGPGAKTEGSPILHLPLASPEELAMRKAAEERLAALQTERETLVAEARNAFARQELARTGAYLLATLPGVAPDPALNPEVSARWSRALEGGAMPALLKVQANFQGRPDTHVRDDGDSLPSSVANNTDEVFKYLSITQPPRSIVVHPTPTEGVGVGWRAPDAATITIGGGMADADASCGNGIAWSMVYREQGVERVLATSEIENGGMADLNVPTPFPVEPGGQILVTVLPRNNEHACDTTHINLQIKAEDGRVWDFAHEVLPQFETGNPWPDASGNPDVWWLFRGTAETNLDGVLFAPWWTALKEVREGRRDATAMQQAAAAIQAALNAALADAASPLAPTLAKLSEPNGPVYIESPPAPDGSRLAAIVAETAALQAQIATPLDLAVGIQEGGVPNTEHAGIHDVAIHKRGDYNNLGDIVPRQMPGIIPGTAPRPVTEGSGRRDLAQWLTTDCAPLLARVMVNRVWQHHFGEGLVRTPGDFGVQGQPPTHPELLDYLAARFIESGWSLKDLHRIMLHTAAYRQSSHPTPEQLQADPENHLIARMNRQRLDAESLRDSFLAVTGQLDPTPGGPAYPDLATPRRTLYYRTNRSNLSTYTQLFDGAEPTSIVPARNELTVAPQALFLMNHPMALSAAEALAGLVGERPMPEPVIEMYRRLYQRAPDEKELAFATGALEKLGYPEPGALVAFAQVMLSSNAFCFVD
jgi:cytochrome c553